MNLLKLGSVENMRRWVRVLAVVAIFGCGRREVPLRERDAELPIPPVVSVTPAITPTPLATLPPAVQPVNISK